MRLINADALTELIKDHEKNLMHNITHSKTRGITTSIDFIRGVEDGYYRILSDIKQMSTIEAEPKKHGRWIEDEYGIPHCSECKAINNTVYRNYCLNCGADMRERREDE